LVVFVAESACASNNMLLRLGFSIAVMMQYHPMPRIQIKSSILLVTPSDGAHGTLSWLKSQSGRARSLVSQPAARHAMLQDIFCERLFS